MNLVKSEQNQFFGQSFPFCFQIANDNLFSLEILLRFHITTILSFIEIGLVFFGKLID